MIFFRFFVYILHNREHLRSKLLTWKPLGTILCGQKKTQNLYRCVKTQLHRVLMTSLLRYCSTPKISQRSDGVRYYTFKNKLKFRDILHLNHVFFFCNVYQGSRLCRRCNIKDGTVTYV